MEYELDVSYRLRMTKLNPIESEFATTEEAAAYDAWFRAEVEAAMASNEPGIPHDEAMARMQAIIDRRKSSDSRKIA
ncbi:stability determinant [Sphingobium sp. MK2]|uniref:type II toxin-antitoxin system RelB family antitoxin n=1 Tax=Sphingobium sp. MK2 TaxID=3116540 RepID=UPI00386FDBC7